MIAPPYLFGSGRRRPSAWATQNLPDWFATYVEPTLGSGARAIATMQARPEHPYLLNSTHPELLAVWSALLDAPGELIAAIAEHAARHDRRHFAGVRDRRGGDLSTVERAARFVYLSGTAGGTARAGLLDDFAQAPCVRDTVAFDAANLRDLAALLADRQVRLDARPLFDLLPHIHEDDFVLLDPSPDVVARELRSFVGTVTAKGAYVALVAALPGRGDADRGDSGLGDGDDRYQGTPALDPSGWGSLKPLAVSNGEPPDWVNGLLARALRAAG